MPSSVARVVSRMGRTDGKGRGASALLVSQPRKIAGWPSGRIALTTPGSHGASGSAVRTSTRSPSLKWLFFCEDFGAEEEVAAGWSGGACDRWVTTMKTFGEPHFIFVMMTLMGRVRESGSALP